MATKTKKKPLSPEQRAERYREQREKLQTAAEQLLTSEGWQRWVITRTKFHRYSFSNTQLIALQCPVASLVNSYKRWGSDFNRQVRKGERAIKILGPIIAKEEVTNRDGTTETKSVLKGFTDVPVFDVSQTDQIEGKPVISLEPPREKLSGDSHFKILGELENFASELGVSVNLEDLSHDSAQGWYSPSQNSITIDSSLEPNAQVRVLTHEIAHALGISYEQYGRSNAEVIVETATYIVTSRLQLDTGGESIPYVAHWGEHNQVEQVITAAKIIDEIAGKIEDAISEEFLT